MSQKDAYPADRGCEQEEIFEKFFFPENYSKKKRQAGMRGKKQVVTRADPVKNVGGVYV